MTRMDRLRDFANQHPLLSYVMLCFGITWPVWFCVPLVAGTDWSLGKIVTGIGFGPAWAVIILDRLRGTGAAIGSRRWLKAFLSVAFIVTCLDVSSLLTGDAISAAGMANAQATGPTIIGLISTPVAGAAAGFMFASVACSRNSRLASLLEWKLPLRCWLVALFLPASWMLLGLTINWIKGDPIDSVHGGLPALSWSLFVLRSIVFTTLVVAVGEEAGWRGWMLPELQKRFSPLLSSIVLGIVWGLWHFPLFLNGQYTQDPILVFAKAGACAFLAILFTWLYNRSGGSLLLAVVLHTALNNTPRLIPATEAMGIGMFAAVIGAIILDRMWRRIRKPLVGTTEPGNAQIAGPLLP
jgi:uncharacterized protein